MKQRYIEIPDTWQDLTPDDWREVLKIRQKVVDNGGRYSELDIKTETARVLLKNRGVKLQLNNPNYVQLVGQVAASLGWLWQAEGTVVSLVYKDTRNLLPKVRQWIGPADHGQDLTFGEFRQAFVHLKAYEQTQTVTPLHALAGLLYRPAVLPSSISRLRRFPRRIVASRLPYDDDSIDEKIARGQQMQPWQVWGIYAWFAYFCEYLTTGTFVIDGCEVSFAPLFAHGSHESTSASGGSPAGNSLQQICLTLAESHVFGTARDVDNTPLLTVMQKLLMDYETLQKIKRTKK